MTQTANLSYLKPSLFYLNMTELKNLCEQLSLPDSGKKGDIVHRILTYLETGKIVKLTPIPDVSKAKKDAKYPLFPDTLILFGNYKNDAATRAFMKALVGNHFHFTAFGLDWTKERWLAGTPPTYAEFAAFWQQEYDARKQRKATPKQEWAYLNFIQSYQQTHPNASRAEISQAWEKTRAEHVAKVFNFLKSL